MTRVISRELLAVDQVKSNFALGTDLRRITRPVRGGNNQVTAYEFVGTDDFSSLFYTRQQYEVDSGRDLEPLLYPDIYSIVNDPSLPKNISIDMLGPAAVIFDEITEGGEVKFVTVGQGAQAIAMRHFAAGLEYSKDIVVYNELWQLPIVERQAGVAYNALLNNVHLGPFINYSAAPTYPSTNRTAASAVGANLIEHYIRTLEDAVTHATNDTVNPRRGPYALLMSTSNSFAMERALQRVPQFGTQIGSSVSDRISVIIAYNGWSGTRGKKAISYPGVAANKAYLIDLGYKYRYLQAFMKQPLEAALGDQDRSRFIIGQVIWDCYFTAFADILATTEEITLPTS